MKLTQDWVGYLDRSYEQIKRSCLVRLGVVAPEISDHSESNPLVLILSMFSGIAEMLNLYIDSNARESFLGTTRRYSSAVKLVKLIDYNIRAMNPASANLLFYLVDNSGNPIAAPSTITIPINSVLTVDISGLPFVLQSNVVINIGQQNVYGKAVQYTPTLGDILGTTNGTANQIIFISDTYVDGSMKVFINAIEWVLYKSFGTMSSTTMGFIISIDENSNAFIQFGDGINGAIPPSSQTIFGDYRQSLGLSGNVPPNTINTFLVPITTPSGITLKVTNPDYASGGTNFESLEDIQNRAPRSIRTLDRAVTYQDYIDLSLQVLGVGAAEVNYCCGKYVDLYIAPSSPGSSSLALLQAVKDFLTPRIMVTTQLAVNASGVSKIWVKANVYGKPLKTSEEIYSQLVNALDLKYGYANLKINASVSIPDITTTVDNLSNIDRIEISQVRILPFARPVETTVNILNISFIVLPHTPTTVAYTLIYRTSITKFEVYKNNFLITTIAIDQLYSDAVVSFKVLTGTYNNSDKWEFSAYSSYPEIFPLGLIEIKDFSAPIIEVGQQIDLTTPRTIYSDLTIIPQGATLGGLPPCN